jgi:hypothetical protein
MLWIINFISLLSLVRFSYQFSSVICLFVQRIKVKYINFILFLHLYFWSCVIILLFKWFCRTVTVLWAWNGLPLNTYISMYARTNYVRTSIPHSTLFHIPTWLLKLCPRGPEGRNGVNFCRVVIWPNGKCRRTDMAGFSNFDIRHLPQDLKGKAIPFKSCTDPKDSRSLRFPDFKTIGTWRW